MSADQQERQAEINASAARKKAADVQAKIQFERNKDRRDETRNSLPKVVLGGRLNTGGAQSKLDTSILNTDTKRKGSRIASYAALNKIKREGTGATQQLGNTMAETGNRRGDAFQVGFQDIRTNTSDRIAQNQKDKDDRETQYAQEDIRARQDFEIGIVDAYYARAAGMDAKARAYLQAEILDKYNIVVEEVTPKIKIETQGETQ